MVVNDSIGVRPFPLAAIGVIVLVCGLYFFTLAAPSGRAQTEQFTVPLHTTTGQTIDALASAGLIKNKLAFRLVQMVRGPIRPGGFMLSSSMNAWQIAGALTGTPSLAWVVIPEGLRKEEIAGILAQDLGWDATTTAHWITTDTTAQYDYTEGVYFPDTYLIPRTESPAAVAQRLQQKFEEVFAPYAGEALRQNIRWPTVLRIASIIQREAAGPGDMPLIAGILWNRLLQNMPLDIDATVQYARGNTGSGWWAPLAPADLKIDSPYNTYLHTGLPPLPICNPGLDAINAVLHPAQTSCLYYLHDSSGQIHCAATYAEHKQNIATYLSGAKSN
ncbi:endolytic transglycosylase MltG [Patescibacteria group bacterium]|nr:endolytic transglycosylase MltG [Patescibacteria group bacterium]